MRMPSQIVKMVWISAEATRARFLPIIGGTTLYRILQILSRFLRDHFNYRKYAKDSIFCREDEMDMCSLLPAKVLDLMIAQFGPKTVLDVGCGTGKSIDYLLSRGIDAVGIEGSPLAISKATFPKRITRADLNKPVSLNRKFDVVFCYEVVEHIHPDYVDILMTTLCSYSDRVILSHAQPHQGGEGHFNEQSDDYWIQQFSRKNFDLDPAATTLFKNCGDYFASNLLVFRKHSKT
jgi:SAM-dependent methyltransferase